MSLLLRLFTWIAAVLLLQGAAVAATLTLSRTSAPPGAVITVTGASFTPNSIVDVYLDLQQVAFQITSPVGGFTYDATVPASHKPGNHTITVMPHSGSGAAAQTLYRVRTDWTTWKGDVTNGGWNRTENVLSLSTVDNADLAWTGPASVYSGIVVSGAAYYFVDSTRAVRAYYRTTRAPLFTVAANANYLLPPAVSGPYLVVARDSGLATYSSVTGALLWQATLPPGVGAPTIHNGTVYVIAEGTANAGLYAFRLNCAVGGATCTPTWRGVGGSTGSYYYPEPGVAIGGGRVFAAMGGNLYAYPLDCNTGGNTCNPTYTRATVNTVTPTYSNGYLYVGSGATLQALDAKCIICGPKWSATLTTGIYRAPTVAGGRLYVTDGDTLRVFPTACGAAVCAPFGSTVVGRSFYSPIFANGVLYVPTVSDVIAYAGYCTASCTPVWAAGSGGVYSNAPYATVSIVDGVIYAPDEGGMKIFEVPVPRSATKSMVSMASLQPDPRFADAEAAWEAKLAARRR